MADLKYGRYKTVVYSLLLIFISVITLTVIGVFLLPVYLVSYLVFDVKSIVLIIVLPVIIGTVVLVLILILTCGVIGFWANAGHGPTS